jgi:adenylate cyclase
MDTTNGRRLIPHWTAGILVGLTASAIVLAADAFFSSSSGGGLQPFLAIELKTYDWRLTHTARPETARTDIALVDIDEASVRALQPYAGRWPWPRVVHSSVIDFLAHAGAKAIVYDLDFAEPDTRTGFKYGDSIWSGAESDNALADSIKAAGNVILLADASYDAETTETERLPPNRFALDAPGILDRKGLLPPFAVLADAAAGLGHNLVILDPDGPLRHVVPFVRSHGRTIPSLGVMAALRGAGLAPADIHLDGTRLRYRDRAMPLTWRHVESSEGTIDYLWGLIDFRGPALNADLKGRTYPTYSFFDVLRSQEQIDAGLTPAVDAAAFRGKIVFVGTTAAGLFDVFETPFSHGKMPGINIHAAVADDILSNRFLRPLPDSVRVATVLLAGVAVGIVATMVPAWWAAACTIAFVGLMGWLAMHLFADGYWLNLSQPVLASSVSLFGGVAYQYFVEGREKRKMKKLFGQYVSKDVYEQLVANPALAHLGGQRRDMTVLFSDIRGFTTVAEQRQPEEIVGMLNEYFTEMVDIVFRHSGTVDKFVGDMVMALFGAPLDDPGHADHAVGAALDMIAALGRLNERWNAEGRYAALEIGVGINTGSMIAGNIGSEAIMSYTVIGDAVNLASRLESLNKEYGTRIIISSATRQRLTGAYQCRPLGDVMVKGKTAPVAIFELVGREAVREDTTV